MPDTENFTKDRFKTFTARCVRQRSYLGPGVLRLFLPDWHAAVFQRPLSQEGSKGARAEIGSSSGSSIGAALRTAVRVDLNELA